MSVFPARANRPAGGGGGDCESLGVVTVSHRSVTVSHRSVTVSHRSGKIFQLGRSTREPN
jgi:hypothetical protein